MHAQGNLSIIVFTRLDANTVWGYGNPLQRGFGGASIIQKQHSIVVFYRSSAPIHDLGSIIPDRVFCSPSLALKTVYLSVKPVIQL